MCPASEKAESASSDDLEAPQVPDEKVVEEVMRRLGRPSLQAFSTFSVSQQCSMASKVESSHQLSETMLTAQAKRRGQNLNPPALGELSE